MTEYRKQQRGPSHAASAVFACACLFVAAVIGCSGRPARIPLAEIDFSASARQAIALHDANGDGLLTRVETSSCPAVVAAFDRIDGNEDDSLSEVEVAEYLSRMQESGVAMVSWTLRITMDGEPLQGATVSLQPAEFLRPGVLPAEGVTDKNGLVTLAVDEEHRPAPNARVLHCGLYNVRVSKRAGDREVIPDRYGESSTLGLEVRPEGQGDYNGALINLSSSG